MNIDDITVNFEIIEGNVYFQGEYLGPIPQENPHDRLPTAEIEEYLGFIRINYYDSDGRFKVRRMPIDG